MQISGFNINVTSEQPETLAAWYRDVLELPPVPEMGEAAFSLGERTAFLIDGHSETRGKAREPQRVLINFMVNDLASERQRLLERGVQFIRPPEREPWGGLITTFLDPDGNYLQLIEYQPGG
jgi:predicted enzyme related to lactoylglutathione lyase